MFINKAPDGKNNICGATVARLRKALGISQRELADRLQLAGFDIEKNGVQRIESGQRFVTDIELGYLSNVLAVDVDELLEHDPAAVSREGKGKDAPENDLTPEM